MGDRGYRRLKTIDDWDSGKESTKYVYTKKSCQFSDLKKWSTYVYRQCEKSSIRDTKFLTNFVS